MTVCPVCHKPTYVMFVEPNGSDRCDVCHYHKTTEVSHANFDPMLLRFSGNDVHLHKARRPAPGMQVLPKRRPWPLHVV